MSVSFLWDLYQTYQIHQLNSELGDMRDSAAQLEGSSDLRAAARLNDKVDRLALICRAMFELVAGKTGITEDELKARMQKLDGGDGRAVPASHLCAKCGAAIPPSMDHCQFCGYQDAAASAFR